MEVKPGEKPYPEVPARGHLGGPGRLCCGLEALELYSGAVRAVGGIQTAEY